MRQLYRQQLRESLGGWSGTVITAVPPVVFVLVNALSSLRPAILSALGSGVLLAIYRLARKQPVQQAVGGLFAVLVAAFIAWRTGEARSYFLFGIWTSFAYAVPFAISVLVRRPLIGVVWEFIDPTAGTRAAVLAEAPGDEPVPAASAVVPWYRTPLLRAYALATGLAVVGFLVRGGVQLALYHEDATGWLAFTRVVMGYPLTVVVAALAVWLVTRARKRFAKSLDALPAHQA